jgi:PucR C-terminal helix-turn-helix domain
VGSSRSSANRSRSSKPSLPEARQVIGERLKARKDEIEQELLAGVGAFSQDESVDPEYAVGLRDSVSVALDYGIECIESSERGAPLLPTSLYAQARLAARNGVKLDVVIKRYMGGYTLLDSFLEEVASDEGLVGTSAYREIRRVSSVLIPKLITDIGEQYHDEIQKQATSPESMRIKQVRSLLDGKPVDTTQFNYDFGGFHIGLVANGSSVARTIKGLAKALDCISMIFEPLDAPAFAWLNRRTPPDIGCVEELASKRWPTESSLAIGEIGEGRRGWRLSHLQAKAGFLVSLKRGGGFFRYGDDPFLATLLQDDLLAESLRQMYLIPLELGEESTKLLRTLHVYFASGRNGAMAAKSLQVSRQTVINRLKAVEDRVGRPLSSCMAELETAMRARSGEVPLDAVKKP